MEEENKRRKKGATCVSLFERFKTKQEKKKHLGLVSAFHLFQFQSFKLCMYGSAEHFCQHSVLCYFMFCYGGHGKKSTFYMGNKLVF